MKNSSLQSGFSKVVTKNRLKNGHFLIPWSTVFIRKVLPFCLSLALCIAGCKKEAGLEETLAQQSSKSPDAETSSTQEFTVVLIPDTQYYTDPDANYHPGGKVAHLQEQMNWIKTNVNSQNIAYVGGLGDVTNHASNLTEWANAKTCYNTLHNYTYTNNDGITKTGIPYGLAVGNHDQEPYSSPTPAGNSTLNYNNNFGTAAFSGKTWYGGHYGTNNDSHYDLFSVGTGSSKTDFIVLYAEYDANNYDWAGVNAWLNTTLATYSDRKAIIICHSLVNNGAFHQQGSPIYNAIKARTNVFMMYSGHLTQENWRKDTYNGNTIRSYVANYQGEINGGDGFMRVLKFHLGNNTIYTRSISPYNIKHGISRTKTSEDSQFYVPAFTSVPTAPVANGKYKIINKKSGKVITVQGASTSNGAAINQWDYVNNSSYNDLWYITKLGTTGYYTIKNVKSGKVLTISSNSHVAGQNANQWDYTANASWNDEFSFVAVAGGGYKIVARHTGLVLNVEGGSTANGAYIQQWPYNAATNAGTSEFTLALVP